MVHKPILPDLQTLTIEQVKAMDIPESWLRDLWWLEYDGLDRLEVLTYLKDLIVASNTGDRGR